MGELSSGRADLAAFPLSLTWPRPQYAALSYSYFNGGIGILVRHPSVTGVLLMPSPAQLVMPF